MGISPSKALKSTLSREAKQAEAKLAERTLAVRSPALAGPHSVESIRSAAQTYRSTAQKIQLPSNINPMSTEAMRSSAEAYRATINPGKSSHVTTYDPMSVSSLRSQANKYRSNLGMPKFNIGNSQIKRFTSGNTNPIENLNAIKQLYKANAPVKGIKNQAKSIFNSTTKNFNYEQAFNIGGRAAIGMAGGMGVGFMFGMAGNIINPDIVSTDNHKVKNAMLIGATAGALGIASGASSSIIKSINKNITNKPWLIEGAKMTQKIANNKATAGALGVAAIAAGADTHFCRSISNINFGNSNRN